MSISRSLAHAGEEYVRLKGRDESAGPWHGDAIDLAAFGTQILDDLMRVVESEGLGLHDAEQDAPAAGTRLPAKEVEIPPDGVAVVPGDVLHHAVVGSHLPGDGFEFLGLGECSGNRPSVRQAVPRQAVGGEADGAVLHGLPGDLSDP